MEGSACQHELSANLGAIQIDRELASCRMHGLSLAFSVSLALSPLDLPGGSPFALIRPFAVKLLLFVFPACPPSIGFAGGPSDFTVRGKAPTPQVANLNQFNMRRRCGHLTKANTILG
jgi:hypothetical protein